jgi:hypothetical protein
MFRALILEARLISEGGGSRRTKLTRQTVFRNAVRPLRNAIKNKSGIEYTGDVDKKSYFKTTPQTSRDQLNRPHERDVAIHRAFTNGPGNGDRDRLAKRKPGSWLKRPGPARSRDFWERPKLP